MRSLKNGLKKSFLDRRNDNIDRKPLVSKNLLYYCTTNESPAKKLFGREIRTRFDLLKENSNKVNREKQIENYKRSRDVVFGKNEIVFAKDYGVPNKLEWAKAKIEDVLGPRSYLCTLAENESTYWKRHADQIIKSGNLKKNTFEELEQMKTKEQYEIQEFVPERAQTVAPDMMIFKEKGLTLKVENDEQVEHFETPRVRIIPNIPINVPEVKTKEEQIEKKVVADEMKNEKQTPVKSTTLNINERLKRAIKKW